MPLSGKGRKIMKSMVKQYGTKRGEQVFYASKNKGTIEGVEENKKMSYLDKILRNLQENEAVKAADAAAEKRKKEAEDRNRRFKEAEKKGEEADKRAAQAAASLSKKESLVYAFNRWAKHLGEAALAEEEDRQAAAQSAGETVANPPRQEMDSNENIKKKREKKKAMDDKIKGMFSGPSSQSKK